MIIIWLPLQSRNIVSHSCFSLFSFFNEFLYLSFNVRENRKRCPEHPVTPDINEKVSKRQFDGRIHVWRRALHEWDNVDQLPIPDSKPRQKRKADSMSLETADTKPSSTSSDDISSKRRKVENQPLEHKISNPSVLHVPSAKEEDNNDHQNTFAIGENEDDGYISEDVL